ncbi:hypothetical protein GGS21DRAFT_541348 [Xylaria nigripes]|nr:hypothetical protein GGS21DRAFT_541348 [Xylaria nigripes]
MRPYRFPYDDEDGLRSVERMSSIQEVSEYSNSRSALASRSTRSTTFMWPFHHRMPSDVPSTGRSSRRGRLRSGTWNSRSFLHPLDETASIDQTIVPDYVINFMRGETPESLAKKKEAKKWAESNMAMSPRDTYTSHFIELDPLSAADPHSIRNGGGRGRLRRYLTGWRGGVAYNILLAFLILVVDIVYLVMGATRTKGFSAQLAIYSGNCSTATRIKIGTSAAINVFGIVLLAGANYIFQVLISPTRDEISKAHDRKRWLDIGVPSLRNVAFISRPRAILGVIVLIIAIAMHVIYNAITVFTPSTQNECVLNVNSSMLVVAVILNAVLVIIMAAILVTSSFEPVATVGDAIRSFLHMPDPTTVSASLLSKTNLQQGNWGPHVTKHCEPRNHYWFEVPSLTRWVLTVLSWLAVGGPTAAAVALMARSSSKGIRTPFGTAAHDTMFVFPIPLELPQLALVTALSQLLLAILYLSTNALLTAFYSSHEFAVFALGPRSLRVSSNPAGTQKTSFYLSLPRPVSWFLLATFAALGLVLSQSAYPVSVVLSDQSSAQRPGVAFNTLALLILIVLLAIILFAIVALGLRRTPNPALANSSDALGNPLALLGGPNSALISARCHPALGEGTLWLRPVAWGVVEEATRSRPGRCSFTSNPVTAFEMGMEYA